MKTAEAFATLSADDKMNLLEEAREARELVAEGRLTPRAAADMIAFAEALEADAGVTVVGILAGQKILDRRRRG